jgi:hypothetical protein
LLNFIESFHEKAYCVEVLARAACQRCVYRNPVEQQPTDSGRSFAGNTQWQMDPYPAVESWKKEIRRLRQ